MNLRGKEGEQFGGHVRAVRAEATVSALEMALEYILEIDLRRLYHRMGWG